MSDDILIVAIIAFVVWCVIPAICVAMVAGSRKREAAAWFFYGLLCWPIALTHVLILPPLKPPKLADHSPGEHTDEDMSHIL